MKKILVIIAIMFCSLAYSQQKPILDSVQVYNPMPKGNLVETYYDIRYFNDKALDRLSKQEKSDTFIVKFYYREYEGAPPKVYVSPFSKVKTLIREENKI